jgi:23S rRNA (uracil1939-C5)-methyltransferase
MSTSVIIESLDQDGRGIAHVDGKAIFIEGALPGEIVTYSSFRKKPSFEVAQVTQILKPGHMRVDPRCRYFGICGGCSMQHLEPGAQVAAKQRVLEDNLEHIGKVKPQLILRATHGPAWGYRQRARLSVRYVEKKGGVLVGFHEKRSSFIADMASCEVLPPRISALIVPLRNMIGKMNIRDRLPQIELAVGDAVDVLVVRNMEPLSDADEQLLRAFADEHAVQFWLQPKGPDTAYPFYPLDVPELSYSLPEFNVVMPFRPTEFTQVNAGINRIMVRRALQLLAPRPGERIADMFCGLGNFSLPIARRGASVVGVEGSLELVKRAQSNAVRNGIADATFLQANLFEATPESLADLGRFDKMLIDPPRDGAVELIKALDERALPHRIVYVSCNPATLARDASVLVHTKGYRLIAAGIMNMFPHTAHVESIALFEQ